MFLGGRIKVFQQNARFGDDAARMDFLHLVHVPQMHHAATGKRHRLTIVSGAGPPRRDGAVMGIAGLQNLDHLGFRARRDHEVGGHMIEPVFQHR